MLDSQTRKVLKKYLCSLIFLYICFFFIYRHLSLIHESGHYLIARMYNVPVTGFRFQPEATYIDFAEEEYLSLTITQFRMLGFSGGLMELLIYFPIFYWMKNMNRPDKMHLSIIYCSVKYALIMILIRAWFNAGNSGFLLDWACVWVF